MGSGLVATHGGQAGGGQASSHCGGRVDCQNWRGGGRHGPLWGTPRRGHRLDSTEMWWVWDISRVAGTVGGGVIPRGMTEGIIGPQMSKVGWQEGP